MSNTLLPPPLGNWTTEGLERLAGHYEAMAAHFSELLKERQRGGPDNGRRSPVDRRTFWESMDASMVPTSLPVHPSYMKLLDKSSHVLELGCGIGLKAEELHRTVGCRVTGIDINVGEIAIAISRNEKNANLQFQQGDASSLPFEDSLYDAVVMVGLLGGLQKELRPKILQEAVRLCKAGGWLYISEFPRIENSSVWNVIYRDHELIAGEYGCKVVFKEDGTVSFIGYHFKSGELEELMQKAGLTGIHTENLMTTSTITHTPYDARCVWGRKA